MEANQNKTGFWRIYAVNLSALLREIILTNPTPENIQAALEIMAKVNSVLRRPVPSIFEAPVAFDHDVVRRKKVDMVLSLSGLLREMSASMPTRGIDAANGLRETLAECIHDDTAACVN